MGALKKKLKKASKPKKFFYYLTLLLYIVAFGFFAYSMLKLKGIEDLIRYIVIAFFGIWFLIYLLIGLVGVLSKKAKTFVIFTIITILFAIPLAGASYYINKVYGTLSSINSDKKTYTTNLIALKETEFSRNLTIGMIDTEDDIEGNVLAKKLIEKENLTNKVNLYDDYNSMISDLYEGKIGACFVSSNYEITFENEKFTEDDEEGSIKTKVKVLYEYSEEMENQDNITLASSSNKKLTEPFTVLVMGVDSTTDGLNPNQAFNGDTLIMVTFNPQTLTATMFSIPRDLYVPIACNGNKYAKINSSAAYGSSCVINTVQNLTGIDIDYYVKINFKGVVQLVDALGGVEVDVETPDFSYDSLHTGQVCEQNSDRKKGSNLVCINPGKQILDGEEALAYARCRHLYATSDIARNAHQQQIIEGVVKKAKNINSITEVEDILDAISNNIETNMTPEQILSFYNVGKDMLKNTSTTALSIKKTHLAYYNLPVWRGNMYLSCLGYYEPSLDAIIKLMKVNLGLKTEEAIKTFEISYNEDYETPVVGKGLTGGTKLVTMPSYIGDSQSNAQSWCTSNGISCSFQTQASEEPAGIIVDQSIHAGTLLKNVKSVTFYLSDGSGTSEKENTEEETNNTTEDSTTYTVTVRYVYSDGAVATGTKTETYSDGESYSITSPTIEGYTPDTAVVSGTIASSDVDVTVTYSKNSSSTSDTETGGSTETGTSTGSETTGGSTSSETTDGTGSTSNE